MIYVFDLDGTLIDSTRRHYTLMESLLVENGILVSDSFRKDYMEYKASGFSSIEYLRNELRLKEKQACEINGKWIKDIESDQYLAMDVLYPDVLHTLENLKHGAKIYFLTARNRKRALLKEIDRLGIGEIADGCFVVGPMSKTETKDMYLRKLSIKYQEPILMIGDTEVDWMAAQKANVDVFILNRGFRNKLFWDKKTVVSYDTIEGLPALGVRH